MSTLPEVDYSAVLADLKEKRDRLDAAINGIEAMLGIQGLSSASSKPNNPGLADATGQFGPGAFLGMTIVDATKKYLSAKRQNQRTEDILNALTDGGIVLTGSAPLNVVGSVLNRNYSGGGEIVKVSRGVWGLAEWHPRLRLKKASTVTSVGEAFGDSEAQAAPEEPHDPPPDESPLA